MCDTLTVCKHVLFSVAAPDVSMHHQLLPATLPPAAPASGRALLISTSLIHFASINWIPKYSFLPFSGPQSQKSGLFFLAGDKWLSPESKLLERKYLHTQACAGTPPLKMLSKPPSKNLAGSKPAPSHPAANQIRNKSTESQNKHPRINRPPRLTGKLPTIKTDTKTNKLEEGKRS